MIVDYSKRASFCKAIAQTLDGVHPCSLCHFVNKGKASEKRSDLQQLTPKIDIICTKRVVTLVLPVVHFDYATFDISVSIIGRSPPVPPPRAYS